MKVLIACEFSGIVRDAFIARGHDVMSCDLLPTEKPGPHYQGDVRNVLDDGWDLMIAHPPCTYLSYAANRVWNNLGRKEKRDDAMKFFMELYNAPIEKICIENPKGYPFTAFRKPDQIIQPYFFGDPHVKTICLWLKNLKPLIPNCLYRKPKPIYRHKKGKKIGEACYLTEAAVGGKDRWKNRSRFFPGIAKAMAKQWR